jgi:hypothetical protein
MLLLAINNQPTISITPPYRDYRNDYRNDGNEGEGMLAVFDTNHNSSKDGYGSFLSHYCHMNYISQPCSAVHDSDIRLSTPEHRRHPYGIDGTLHTIYEYIQPYVSSIALFAVSYVLHHQLTGRQSVPIH